MITKKFIPLFAVILVVLVSLLSPSHAEAGSGTCGGNVTVAAGDTLRKIADRCYTTVFALQLANGISNPNLIYVGAGPGHAGRPLEREWCHGYLHREARRYAQIVAADFNTDFSVLLTLNPAITNANLIYEGQRLNVPTPGSVPPTPVPTSGQVYVVQRGDTMKKIADRLGVSLEILVQANPQVTNINLIYVGQRLNLPAGVSVYIVVRGDTLRTDCQIASGPHWKPCSS